MIIAIVLPAQVSILSILSHFRGPGNLFHPESFA
jgi:hypothetical protein